MGHIETGLDGAAIDHELACKRSGQEAVRAPIDVLGGSVIQQHDEQPSVYREVIDKQGYGFHHWGIASDRFDNDLSSYVERGFELVFTDETPVSTRVAYLDPKRGWPGFIELIEINTASELRYSKMYADALLWDGADPIRKV